MSELYPMNTLMLSEGWVLVAATDYSAIICPNSHVRPELQKLIDFCIQKNFSYDFRREVSINGFPLLCGVFPKEKKILVGSRRLSRELAILAAAEIDGSDEKLGELKGHVEKVSTLDHRFFPSEWEFVTWENKLPDWSDTEAWKDVEELTHEKLQGLIKHVQAYQPTMFERVSDWGLGLTAQFALIRVHLLKFLALLPSLDHDKSGNEVKKNLIEEAKTLIKKYAEQQKNVRNNREFNSLTKEIEFQELETQLAEKHIKEFKVQIEQKKEVISETKDRLKDRQTHLKHKKGELNAILAETEKEETALIKKSEEFQNQIETRLVEAYHRIRQNVKNGLAVVPIERGASGGSFFTIPPQVQVEIASRKKVITDEHSGRILVDAQLAEEEKAKMEKMFAKLA